MGGQRRHPSFVLHSGSEQPRIGILRSSAHSLVCITHSFTCSELLTSLERSAALIHSLARSLILSRAREKVNDMMSQNDLVLSLSVLACVLAVNHPARDKEFEETTFMIHGKV